MISFYFKSWQDVAEEFNTPPKQRAFRWCVVPKMIVGGHNLYEQAEWIKARNLTWKNFDSCLKIGTLSLIPHIMLAHYWRIVYTTVIWMSLLSLCAHIIYCACTSHRLDYVVISTPFCSVCGSHHQNLIQDFTWGSIAWPGQKFNIIVGNCYHPHNLFINSVGETNMVLHL